MACKYTYKGITYNSKEEFISQVINPQFLNKSNNSSLLFIKSNNTIDDDFYIKDELIITKELQNIRTNNFDGSINIELLELKDKINKLPVGSKFNTSEYTKPSVTNLDEVLSKINLSESNKILLEKIKPLIKNVKIEYVDKFILSNSGAVYSDKYNTIRINKSEKNIPLEELLMHELLHAATFRKISYFETNTKGLSEKEKAALAELENIRKVLKEASNKYWDNRPRYARSINPLEGYRSDSIHEIISYAFTNEEFRNAISEIPYKENKSILDKLIELIANIFGVKQDTVLSALLANTEVLLENNKGKNNSTKTRRILEVQSDLFQKGRDFINLTPDEKNKIGNRFTSEENGKTYEVLYTGKNINNSTREIAWYITENGMKVEKIGKDTKLPNDFLEYGKYLPDNKSKNKFLQLLNKDNNWVTFFVKSIIQDSAKKGYEKVLFPTGDTASKVEGHSTLEEFKKQKEDRIKELEKDIYDYTYNNYRVYKKSDNISLGNTGSKEDTELFFNSNNLVQKNPSDFEIRRNDESYIIKQKNNEINQLKQELERVEREGFGALRPIYKFYENTVTNILKKQGYNPVLITDEYGNTWNEIKISKEYGEQDILFQLPQNREIEEFIASEKTIRDLAARMSDRIGIPVRFESDRSKEYKGKLENGTAIVNLAYATLDTPIHEILGHPIIRAIKGKYPLTNEYIQSEIDITKKLLNKEITKEEANRLREQRDNPTYSELYKNLLKELEYGKGKEVLYRVKKEYVYKQNKYTPKSFDELVLEPYEIEKSDRPFDTHGYFVNENGDTFVLKYIETSVGWDKVPYKNDLQINESSYFKEYLKEYSKKYDTLYTLEEQQEEAIVELLGLMTAEKLDAVKDGKLISLLKRLLKEMKAFMRSLINQKEVEIDKLPDNMTLGDIANLLAYSNSKLILPGYEVEYTTPDNNKFKTYQEASNHISELAKNVKDVDLDDIKINPNLEKEIKEKRDKLDKELLDIQNKLTEANDKINNFEKEIKDSFGDTPRMFTKEELNYFKELKEKLNLNFLYQEEQRVNKLINEIRLEEGMFGSSGNTILNFIQKNKEYEQSKEIIEEWKKINNIVYNPEEVYSRGQEFVSVVGAYSSFDVNLMMQNLLTHIEDNKKAGGKFAISAYTKPTDKQIGHLEGGGGKIKFKLYPQSNDILWAANTDVYSGSVWDASEKVNKDKKSELLGVSYTKYPSLSNVNAVQPNLAAIVDDLAHHHNELGIVLTGNNFRLEYDENIPYSTKKIIDSINSILDQKYGKLVKPEIKINDKKISHTSTTLEGKYKAYLKGGEEYEFNTQEELNDFTKSLKQIGIQPTQTNAALKESIEGVKNKIMSFKGDISEIPNKFEGYTTRKETGEKLYQGIVENINGVWKINNQIINEEQVKKLYFQEKEYTSQALINTKIAKLKEVAKSYPLSLIRSEVRPINNSQQNYGFEKDELLFQKLSKSPKEILQEKLNEQVKNNKQVVFDTTNLTKEKRQNQNSKRPLTDNFVEYKNYKLALLETITKTLHELYISRRNPKKNIKEINDKIDKLVLISNNLKNDITKLEANEIVFMFQALVEEIGSLNNELDSNIDITTFKSRLEFLYKFIKGISIDNKVESELESLKTFNHPDFEKISLSVDELNLKYKSKLNLIKNNIIKSDITYYNNVLSNDRVTKEDLENMFNTPNDINWLEKTFLGINSTSGEESIIPQILKSFLEEKVTLREAEVKSYKDRLKLLAKKLNNNLDFIFEKSENGVKTGNIISVVSPKYAKKLSEYNRIASSKDKKEVEKYSEKINWLSNNAVVIDFRKLKIVKDLYGSIYPENFIYTDREMEEYEKYIQEEIGPLYDKTISKILNNLENFQAIKNNILESDSAYKDANIARINPWEFLSHYYSKNRKESLKINNGTSINVVYPDASNIVFIPKRSIFLGFNESGDEVSIDTGYYNLDFNDIVKDNDKLEYWNLISEIYEDFISPTYDNQYLSKLSFAKFEKDSIEAIDSSKGLLKGTTLLRESLNSFKSFFYERGYYSNKDGIRNNYSDNTANEIRDLSKILSLKNKNEILDTAKKLNIKTDGVIIDTIIKEIATYQVMESYSFDITKTTLALLDMTALQKARQDVLPISNILLDSHKLQSMEVRDGDKTVREERKNSVEKLENWINRVVKNQNEVYRGSASFIGKDISKNTLLETILNKMGNIPFIKRYINKKSSYLLSDTDKKILEELRKLQETGHNKDSSGTFKLGDITYRIANSDTETFYSKIVDTEIKKIDEKEYGDMFQIYVQDKINSLGIPLNTAGIIQGILKTIILKSLGFNPTSGIFNRIEGKNSGLIMDQTGSYWTKGNIHAANNFMAFANFIKFLPERFTPDQYKKVQELEKLQVLLYNMNLIQDRRNELDRNAESSKFNYEKLTNIYQFAVDNPEFKNQGAILLSILMDTKIKDIDGNEVAVFDGTGFPIYDNVDDRLVLKPEFRTEENISNWENFNIDETNLENNQYFLTRNKIKNAISRSQGNYDNLDVINATKNIWGRALTLFMKWMPEHFMQRFSSGKGFDLSTGKKAKKGRYRYLWDNHPALLTTGVLSLFIGFGLTPVTGLVGLGFTGFVIGKYFMDLYGNKGIQREANNTMEFVAFAKSIVINTLNYPLEFFNSNKMISQEFGDKIIPGYSKTNLSQEEINNLQAVAKELAIKLTFSSVMLLAKKLTWDDDDDEDSNKRQVHNFIDNQLTRLISSLSNWTNPHALASDIQRFAFLRYLWEIEKLMVSIINMDEDIIDNTLKVSPLPRILHKGSLPWEDNIEYENNQWQDKFIKDINSDGEYSSKKEYYKKLREKREELEKSPKLQKYSEKERDKEISRIIYKEFGKKNEKNTYTELLNNYKKDK